MPDKGLMPLRELSWERSGTWQRMTGLGYFGKPRKLAIRLQQILTRMECRVGPEIDWEALFSTGSSARLSALMLPGFEQERSNGLPYLPRASMSRVTGFYISEDGGCVTLRFILRKSG